MSSEVETSLIISVREMQPKQKVRDFSTTVGMTEMAALRFHLVPNAKSDKVVGEHGDAIKIKLRAPAVEGKANIALRSFLAEELKIPKRAIVISHGHKSRDKLVRIDGLTEENVRRRLLTRT